MRLNKYISESGVCSRREADRFIDEGKVIVNGKKAKIGLQVSSKDKIIVNGIPIQGKAEEDEILIAFNKPVGVTCTTEEGVRDNIVNYVNHSQRIFPIGRLDKDSQGLIFLTNNGDLVNKILRAGNKHEKEYVVTVDKPIDENFVTSMSNGVPILGSMTKKCVVVKEGPKVFRIVLIQGLNRQIRRMCEHFGYEVVKLERVRIMHIPLKGIALGDWRELTNEEMEVMKQSIAHSSSESKKMEKGDKPEKKKKGIAFDAPGNNRLKNSENKKEHPFHEMNSGNKTENTKNVKKQKPAVKKDFKDVSQRPIRTKGRK